MSKKIQGCTPSCTRSYIRSCIRGYVGAFFAITLAIAVGGFLAAGCGGGDRSGSTVGFETGLGIVPETTRMFAGDSQTIHASFIEGTPTKAPLAWKVREGDTGGNVAVVHQDGDAFDGTVTYTAPQIAGTYHVEVSGVYGSSTKTRSAAIEVKWAK